MSEESREVVSLAQFVRQLWETGRIEVRDNASQEFSAKDLADAWIQLQWCASEEQLSLPGPAPGLSRVSAEWALLQFYRACSYFVHRNHASAEMQQVLDPLAPELPSPVVCYSVDLTFRFLPDLHRLTRERSENDPLVDILQTWGRQWPLSSVGIKLNSSPIAGIEKPIPPSAPASKPQAASQAASETSPESPLEWDVSPWWEHLCLKRLYLDRVFNRVDVSRLSDPRVAAAAREALGQYSELAPHLSSTLKSLPPRDTAKS